MDAAVPEILTLIMLLIGLFIWKFLTPKPTLSDPRNRLKGILGTDLAAQSEWHDGPSLSVQKSGFNLTVTIEEKAESQGVWSLGTETYPMGSVAFMVSGDRLADCRLELRGAEAKNVLTLSSGLDTWIKRNGDNPNTAAVLLDPRFRTPSRELVEFGQLEISSRGVTLKTALQTALTDGRRTARVFDLLIEIAQVVSEFDRDPKEALLGHCTTIANGLERRASMRLLAKRFPDAEETQRAAKEACQSSDWKLADIGRDVLGATEAGRLSLAEVVDGSGALSLAEQEGELSLAKVEKSKGSEK